MSSTPKKSRGGLISPVTVAVLVVVLAVIIQVATIPSITGPPSARKPYSTFQQFYPHYQSEHTNETNRYLHFIGTSIVILLFLANPQSIPSIFFAGCVGYILCPLLIGLEHGFVELAATMGTFLAMHKISRGKIGVAGLIPIVGYGFAWVGHFFHEHNRPATFIYPVYSLMGDFNMFYRLATGLEKF